MDQLFYHLPRRALFTVYRTNRRHLPWQRSSFLQNLANQSRKYADQPSQASTNQANPLEGYYKREPRRPLLHRTPPLTSSSVLLDDPPTIPPPPSQPPSVATSLSQKDHPSPPITSSAPSSRPRGPTPGADDRGDLPSSVPSQIFGSRTSPSAIAERKAALEARSTVIAGVKVPPRPEEPDNCCMSGCVNCVWDLYRDEMEEWAAKSREARQRLQAQEAGFPVPDGKDALPGGSVGAASMDDDGGGSEGLWQDAGGEELFGDIPVGIREFMRTEKRLKERQREAPAAG